MHLFVPILLPGGEPPLRKVKALLAILLIRWTTNSAVSRTVAWRRRLLVFGKVAKDSFIKGKTAMIFTGPWNIKDFQAAKVKQQYWEQTDKGGKGAESLVAWDIKQNKEVG